MLFDFRKAKKHFLFLFTLAERLATSRVRESRYAAPENWQNTLSFRSIIEILPVFKTLSKTLLKGFLIEAS